MTNNSTIN